MKKYFALFACVIIAGFVFSQEFTPSVPVFSTPRYSAIGGYHVTDTSDYFTIFANPAGIPAAGKKSVWPGVYVNVGGPLAEAAKLVQKAISGNIDMQSDLLGIVGDNGANASMELMGPITLGTLGKNFGWGFFNKAHVSAMIPSVTSLNAVAGVDFMLRFAYGLPVINKEKHFLSVGLAVKGIFSGQGLLKNKSPLDLMKDFSTIAEQVPIFMSAGFGFDAGILYKFNNILSLGVVWNDFYTPLWIKKYGSYNKIISLSEESTTYAIAPNKVNIGVGVRIPMGKAEKIITAWNFMIDYKDFVSLFTYSNDVYARNPLLNLSAGTELVLLNFFALRAGLSDMYFNAGVGFKIGVVRIDFSMYGKELGLEPGSLPQLNAALSIGVNY